MSIQDDIFDLTDFIAAQGGSAERKAWGRIQIWAAENEEEAGRLREQLWILTRAARILVNLTNVPS